MNRIVLGTALVAAISAGPAFAATEATATADLNLRAGPGPNFEIVSVIPSEGTVSVDGCIAESNWCQVSYDGTAGWAYGSYLTAPVEGQAMVVIENREAVSVPVVTYEEGAGATEGAAMGAVAGALIAGPVGAAAGAMLGAMGGDAATADTETKIRTYVVENPVEPVYLDGEVVLGASVPAEVTVYPVPETQYSYLYVNGNQVVVDNETRAIVYVVR